MQRHHLILGGARSGKTAFAERWVAALGPRRVYVATAEPHDAEMADRSDRHRLDRGAAWRTSEAPLDPAAALSGIAADGVLIDCLTLWLSNLMLAGRDIDAAWADLAVALAALPCPAALVSNETGLGIVPDNALARRFRDLQGRLNQDVAAAVGRVTFVAAGLPLPLKPPGCAASLTADAETPVPGASRGA